MNTPISVTPFINILVWVKRNANGGYDVTYQPAVPLVVQPDTVINYQIVDTYGENIIFSGLSVAPIEPKQISYAVSVSGKVLSANDANTYSGILSLNLQFTNPTRGETFTHDPQIRNEPQG
ncbi:hypothetical protein GTP58_23160 [Duganella sp. CY15W]|uniref:hypothetical protein n=1 Tax=Duganella sp. CY15W TaxID=2692172 RepID=UPI001369DA05|nr:hypothetical protein [Duganella sp. CY15W]MYM31242.1 hypothetical protein [Duganella sp. CY15W]